MATVESHDKLNLDEIHIAILRGDQEAVCRLAKRKDKLQKKNAHGSTPLMLAALMGRAAFVVNLLMCKADFRVTDNRGRTARDYARNDAAATQLVDLYERLGYPVGLARSTSAKTDLLALFREPEALRSVYRRGDHYFSRSYIYQLSRSFFVFPSTKPITVGEIIGPSTVGFIAGYGETSIEKVAISGFGPTETSRRSSLMLDKEEYTELVREICTYLDFLLPGSQNDNGGSAASPEQKGRYHACHVEKKLCLYWVQKALIYEFGTIDLSRLWELKQRKLPPSIRRAKIFLTRRPCYTCYRFIAIIRQVTGLDISIESLPLLDRRSRHRPGRPAGCPRCNCPACNRIFASERPERTDARRAQGLDTTRAIARLSEEFEQVALEVDTGAPIAEEGPEDVRLRESASPFSEADANMEDPPPAAQPRARLARVSAGPVEKTSPCKKWRPLGTDRDGYVVAKPVPRRITSEQLAWMDKVSPVPFPKLRSKGQASNMEAEDEESDDDDDDMQIDPVSTRHGRSMYFDDGHSSPPQSSRSREHRAPPARPRVRIPAPPRTPSNQTSGSSSQGDHAHDSQHLTPSSAASSSPPAQNYPPRASQSRVSAPSQPSQRPTSRYRIPDDTSEDNLADEPPATASSPASSNAPLSRSHRPRRSSQRTSSRSSQPSSKAKGKEKAIPKADLSRYRYAGGATPPRPSARTAVRPPLVIAPSKRVPSLVRRRVPKPKKAAPPPSRAAPSARERKREDKTRQRSVFLRAALHGAAKRRDDDEEEPGREEMVPRSSRGREGGSRTEQGRGGGGRADQDGSSPEDPFLLE